MRCSFVGQLLMWQLLLFGYYPELLTTIAIPDVDSYEGQGNIKKANFEIVEKKTEASEKWKKGGLSVRILALELVEKKNEKSIWLSHQANNPSKLVVCRRKSLMLSLGIKREKSSNNLIKVKRVE